MSWNHPIERCEVGGSKGRGIIENVYQRLEFLPRPVMVALKQRSLRVEQVA